MTKGILWSLGLLALFYGFVWCLGEVGKWIY